MAGLGWLFAWAKENGIDLPLGENGAVDIQKLLKLYDEWRKRGEEKASGDKPTVQKAHKFNRLNTAHHQRHAKEIPKPIALCERAIVTSSRKHEIVLDVFGGSGTTLIACEQTGRKCYMMELDPKYCDVIVKRWENLTGEKSICLKK